MTDTDRDGVSDFYDKCHNTSAGTKVDGVGCELPKVIVPKPITTYIITEEEKKEVPEAIKNIEFDLAKSTIRFTSFAS
jgi:OOP family OmpA-OmpF porin